MKLSVIVPAYNEEATVGELLDRVLAVPLAKEVIVVDDGSRDGTPDVIAGYRGRVVSVRLEANRGKGAAVREGLKRATGDYVLVQDADLELAPEDYPQLLAALGTDGAAVVYGSRFLRGRGAAPRLNHLANRLITGWANLLYGSHLSDVSTGYKLFPRSLTERLDLRAERFEFCAEVTAKLLRLGVGIAEVAVSYSPRPPQAGKKLRYLRDGVAAAWTLLRWRMWQPAPAVVPATCCSPHNPEA